MKNIIIFIVLFLIFVSSFFLFVQKTYAYLDPGTTGSAFSFFSGIIPFILLILGFLTLPFRRLVLFILKKIKSAKNKK
jgi:hypothetical protein